MPVSEQLYQQIALEDPEGQWELWCGALVSKPTMTARHNDLMFELAHLLRLQLHRDTFRVRVNSTRTPRSNDRYYIPDVCVVPTALALPLMDERDILEAYPFPLPLVVEVWSPSTGDYDVDEKLPEYQRRGDAEIWRLHPFERTLTAWRRQPDGSYTETVQQGGAVRPVALPTVTIDLDALFE